MRRLLGSIGLLLGFSLLIAPAAGCGSDNPPGPYCPQACGGQKPYCGPNGTCVQCLGNPDCGPGQYCGNDFKCHG